MLINTKINKDESFVDWCISTAKEIFGFDLNWQQIRLLECLDDNNYTIVKSFRCAGLTTIFILKVAYDITHIINNDEHRILFVSQGNCSAKNSLTLLMKILDCCQEPIYCQKINQSIVKLSYNENNITIRFSGPNIKNDLRGEKQYNDLYIDDCAFIDTCYKEDCIKNEINNYKSYDKIIIGSTPNRQEGIFYDIWSFSEPKYSIFEPFALKWYFDDRFNKNLKYRKNKMLYDIKNSGMLCDALQNNFEITNEWRENMKKMIGNNIYTEIDSNFIISVQEDPLIFS